MVPRETPDGFLIAAGRRRSTIGRGRMYVDGLLVENHGGAAAEWDPTAGRAAAAPRPSPYDGAAYLPDPPALPAGAGPHLVYLESGSASAPRSRSRR